MDKKGIIFDTCHIILKKEKAVESMYTSHYKFKCEVTSEIDLAKAFLERVTIGSMNTKIVELMALMISVLEKNIVIYKVTFVII